MKESRAEQSRAEQSRNSSYLRSTTKYYQNHRNPGSHSMNLEEQACLRRQENVDGDQFVGTEITICSLYLSCPPIQSPYLQRDNVQIRCIHNAIAPKANRPNRLRRLFSPILPSLSIHICAPAVFIPRAETLLEVIERLGLSIADKDILILRLSFAGKDVLKFGLSLSFGVAGLEEVLELGVALAFLVELLDQLGGDTRDLVLAEKLLDGLLLLLICVGNEGREVVKRDIVIIVVGAGELLEAFLNFLVAVDVLDMVS